LEQVEDLLQLDGMGTDISNYAGNPDPVGTLADATQHGPVIVGLTLTQTVSTPGPRGFPINSTGHGGHAIVVDRVEGTAPNRQVVVIDSVTRPTRTTWSNYYKEPEAMFLKAWQVQNGTGIDRLILQSHPLPGLKP
jgi:hypothetical protein